MKNRKVAYVVMTLALAVAVFLAWLLLLPAINLQDPLFWTFVVGTLFIWGILASAIEGSFGGRRREDYKAAGIAVACGVGIAAVGLLIALASSVVFHAKTYAGIMAVTEKEAIADDLPSAETTSSIALMDTDSAAKLGDRKIGSLAEVVSQYDVSGDYSQIAYQDEPLKVSALEYAGIIKYFRNRGAGIPGYITVSPSKMDADYVELDEGMRYVPSAYFLEDLYRHVRLAYPTALLDGYSFELDDEGNPYYTFPVFENQIFLFGGRDVKGVIAVDPVSGDMQYYDVGDVPEWIDRVYDGDLLCDQYNWHGLYTGGFFNSIFSQTGCRKITEISDGEIEEGDEADASNGIDYGYVVKDNDVWVFTGVTSLNSDQSNIGFVLMNERTKECNFYPIAGADEQSAMRAAEGELQQYGYKASFPSLIDIDGVPTYIMVLKDASGLVKQYAAVNVAQYNIVATADTQAECINRYNELLGKGALVDDSGQEKEESAPQETLTPVTVTIAKIEYVTVDGDTWVYILGTDQQIYKTQFGKGANEQIMRYNVGDTLQISVNSEGVFDLPENTTDEGAA